MNWQEVCEHPSLQNLPFKIELDEYGKILMSPTRVYHGIYQGELVRLSLHMVELSQNVQFVLKRGLRLPM